MEYVEVKDNIITGHFCGALPENKEPNIQYIVFNDVYNVNIGDDVRIYEDIQTGKKKSLQTLIKEGFVQIPEGKKLNKEGTDFEDMSEVEKVHAGLIKLTPYQKIENDRIVRKTEKELYDEGLISKEQYNQFIDEVRQSAYAMEADPLCAQFVRGDVEKSIWLAKIEEIKKRYPKIKDNNETSIH